MAEETSIVIKAEDRYSDKVKAMRDSTKAFSKDAEELQKKLETLSKKKASLQIDVKDAQKALRETEKTLDGTGDALKKAAATANQMKLNGLRDELKSVNDELRQTERQIKGTSDAGRRAGNEGGLAKGLMSAGLGRMVSQAANQLGDSFLSSTVGEPMARAASGILSGVISGAAVGSMMGPAGTAIGAAVGGLSGLASGGAQIFQAEDEAFKSYVQEAAENVVSARAGDISSGSGIAAGRERDLISFSTLFGSRNTAQGYLSDLVDMANTTPFLYDDLTAMSKTLATYGYGANSILPVLQTIGDAGAALGMGTGDMTMVATALGRMKSSDKTTLEYLNILNDRGIGAVGMLADAYGVDQGTIYEQISKGEIAGGDAVKIILKALTEKFSGSMLEQSKTFSGLTSTLEGLEQEQQNAYGEGFNEVRKQGLNDQISFLSGESGEQMEAANKAIGAWYASLENEKERFLRQAQQDVLESDAYKEAMAAGTDEGYAEAGRLLMEAKVKAQNEYNASDGAKLLRESELTMIEQIRNDTSLSSEYWSAGYEKGQEYSKGLAAGAMSRWTPGSGFRGSTETGEGYVWGVKMPGYAYGLDRVPYDNYPALLHQGERVLTAREARQADYGGGGVSVQIGQVSFGSEVGDPERAADLFAQRLLRDLQLAQP
ncbi:tape measure protein [Vermiculatibacterium agrestimuris]|uniref:tape measure protein n=1 Tax=Vermiculatibacterium agrestimuris TaxID=2941519 RepID=UPI00203C0452|nr:tape measure protein [Vermiculatibacterium agrestimuris]